MFMNKLRAQKKIRLGKEEKENEAKFIFHAQKNIAKTFIEI